MEQENNPSGPINTIKSTEEPKQNNFLISLLSILLLISVFIAGFFAYQTQKLVKELRVIGNKPEPTASPTQTPDPTADWKTYTNTKYGFSFKYPQPDELSSKYDKFTDKLVEINGLDSLIIKIEPINTTESDPSIWWSKQAVDPFMKRSTACYNKSITRSITSRYTEVLDNTINPVVDFNTDVVLLRQEQKQICNEPPFNQIILIPTKNGEILSIQEGYSVVGEQILSTFKLIEPAVSSSPVACTMDAKICPNGSAVGRSGPKCEFDPCPTTKPSTTSPQP